MKQLCDIDVSEKGQHTLSSHFIQKSITNRVRKISDVQIYVYRNLVNDSSKSNTHKNSGPL